MNRRPCEQKPINLYILILLHILQLQLLQGIWKDAFSQNINPIFGITLINLPWWFMMTPTSAHTQKLHNHVVFGFLSCISSYERWRFVFVFLLAFGVTFHTWQNLGRCGWGHASTTLTREGKSQRHRWHVVLNLFNTAGKWDLNMCIQCLRKLYVCTVYVCIYG